MSYGAALLRQTLAQNLYEFTPAEATALLAKLPGDTRAQAGTCAGCGQILPLVFKMQGETWLCPDCIMPRTMLRKVRTASPSDESSCGGTT